MNPAQPFARKQVFKKGLPSWISGAKLRQNPLEKTYCDSTIGLVNTEIEDLFNNFRCGKPFHWPSPFK
jgi:hypothetical protein